MSKSLKPKKYTFDFYQLTPDSSDLFSTPAHEYFDKLIDETLTSEYASHGSTRDIYGLKYNTLTKSYSGQFRKIRKADLPEVGEPGRVGKKLQLNDREGVIEKNFFVYFIEHSLLVMHRNDNASSGTHLAQLLSAHVGAPFFADPLILPEQAEQLLNGKINIKRFNVRIPKPTHPERYPQDSLSSNAINLLNKSDADHIDITFSVDSKVEDSKGRLSSTLQSAIRPLLSMGATKAILDADENGLIHPIDLIANRIYSIQTILTNSTFPPSESMYNLAAQAKADKQEVINAYFDKTNRRIN